MNERGPLPHVAVVGGGLAGMASAVALSTSACRVTLIEARRYLGGRATSFRDSQTGESVDLCQHVSMGCCTNLADFCRRTGIAHLFRREKVLHFLGPDGRRYDLSGTQALPAPLHLAPALSKLRFLSLGDRIAVARALWRLARTTVDPTSEPTVRQWLTQQRQSVTAVEGFWGLILQSALGESLERAGLAAARKVFVDGFMTNRDAYVMEVPQVPLAEIYDGALRQWFQEHQVELLLATMIGQVDCLDNRLAIQLSGDDLRIFDAVVIAVPWRQIGSVVGPNLGSRLTWLTDAAKLESSPISGVHLWFDRPITDLQHAVLVGRTSQWLFARGQRADNPAHYYQVVVSASRELEQIGQQETIRTICDDLTAVFPAMREARLLHARVVTDPHAVFSVRPGCEKQRPAQRIGVRGLAIAGDWTATGWPATMEGAVRSGYLAAEAVLADLGKSGRFLQPDLPRGWLARWLIK